MRLVWNETCLKMCLVSKNGTRLKEWDSFEKVRLVWKNETRLKIWDSCEKMRLAWKTSIVWNWALLVLGYIESLVSLVWMFDDEFDFQTSFGLFQLEIETLI